MSARIASRVAICFALAAAGLMPAAGAQAVFRCTGAAGVPLYSDHVCGPDATRVQVPPPAATMSSPPPVEAAKPTRTGAADGVNINLDNENVVNVPAAGEPQTPVFSNGGALPFSVFRRLDNGMSVGQVLAIAGAPARDTLDSINTFEGIKRMSYYYVNHGYNASITRIQFVNGRVVRIDRTPLIGN